MHALYLLRHSPHGDEEIRYSLRSIERHAPHIRKVWIFGDRPAFLTNDTSIAEHVPHEAVACHIGATPPVRNIFLLLYLGSLIPGLSDPFIRFSDDYILTGEYTPEMALKARYLKNLADTRNWGQTRWQRQLRRSYDLCMAKGLTAFNFEAHVPQMFRKDWLIDARYMFSKQAKEGRYEGLIGNTEILNFAHTINELDLTHVATEGKRFGFWREKAQHADIVWNAVGKTFLNFDDAAWSVGLEAYLRRLFPEPSRYEKES